MKEQNKEMKNKNKWTTEGATDQIKRMNKRTNENWKNGLMNTRHVVVVYTQYDRCCEHLNKQMSTARENPDSSKADHYRWLQDAACGWGYEWDVSAVILLYL